MHFSGNQTQALFVVGLIEDLNCHINKILETNYAEKTPKVSNSLGCWNLRRMALLGKVTVRKSLIVCQLVYILSPLPTNQRVLEGINTPFFNFLWMAREIRSNDIQ